MYRPVTSENMESQGLSVLVLIFPKVSAC